MGPRSGIRGDGAKPVFYFRDHLSAAYSDHGTYLLSGDLPSEFPLCPDLSVPLEARLELARWWRPKRTWAVATEEHLFLGEILELFLASHITDAGRPEFEEKLGLGRGGWKIFGAVWNPVVDELMDSAADPLYDVGLVRDVLEAARAILSE